MLTRLAFILFAYLFSLTACYATFFDQVLTYDDAQNAKGMHLKIEGCNKEGRLWVTREVTYADFDFLQSLYGDERIMALVGSGITRDDTFVRQNMDMWIKTYEAGSPLSAWILEYKDNKTPIGIFIADTVHDPGVLEVCRIIHTRHQRKGIGTSLMHAVVKIWAPMIQTLGINSRNQRQGEVFRCFKGMPLEKLYISCSPTNFASWKSQVSAGFKPIGAENALPIRDSLRESSSYQVWEERLTKLFKTTIEEDGVLSGKLFHVVDPEGNQRTVSLHPKYNRIKYHFECKIGKR